jgi:hypothetical protein
VTGQSQVELWQPSLDDVLGDSLTKSRHDSQKTASGTSNTSGTASSSSVESSPRKWREWDASRADKNLREIQAASEVPTAGSSKRFPVLVDIHREVTVRDGARVKVVNFGTGNGNGSTPPHLPSPRQPVRNAKNPAKIGNDKKAAADQKSQPVRKLKYLGSTVVTKTPPSKLKGPQTSPLQLVSANLSTAVPPICLPDQTASASLKTVPHLHHFEAVNKDPSSRISLDLMVKKDPFDYIFQEVIIDNSTKDEEDLISFD